MFFCMYERWWIKAHKNTVDISCVEDYEEIDDEWCGWCIDPDDAISICTHAEFRWPFFIRLNQTKRQINEFKNVLVSANSLCKIYVLDVWVCVYICSNLTKYVKSVKNRVVYWFCMVIFLCATNPLWSFLSIKIYGTCRLCIQMGVSVCLSFSGFVLFTAFSFMRKFYEPIFFLVWNWPQSYLL